MPGLSAGETANTIKTLSEGRVGALCRWTPQRGVPPGPANSLYKPMLIPAALACANIGPGLDIPASWSLLPVRARSGTKAHGSAPQAGHDHTKRCAKQEIHRRRIIADQQTSYGGNILRSPETALEKFLRNPKLLHYRNSIPRLTTADAARTRFRHSRQ